MTRTYAREEIKWDLDTLRALAALEPPQATFFEAANRWVVKQDGASFAVRPEQIVSYEEEQGHLDQQAELATEMAYERYLEDGGSHAAVIAAEDAFEREMEARDEGLQRMRAERVADPFQELNANRVAARRLVEEVFTLRHGIAENRDGEFDAEERALVEQILQDESGEVTVALREEIAEAQYRAQEARTGVYVPAPAPRSQHWAFSAEADDLLARFTK